jgi:eukaryotic-like serine/threonine-protein kinase
MRSEREPAAADTIQDRRQRRRDERVAPVAAGTVVGPYRIERALGRGGMGAVYLARDTVLRRSVALKVIAPELLGSRPAIERFLQEARATARLNHPNIVTIHAVGTHEGAPYLALEYVEGESLRQRLRAGRLPLDEALRIALGMADALCEAHGHGILHRDLKPENAMLPPGGRLRIVDFGLAEVAPPPTSSPAPDLGAFDEVDAGERLARSIGGTPPYMAPEQWRCEECTPATDLWAFGVVLFEMCSGRLPFDGEAPAPQTSQGLDAGATREEAGRARAVTEAMDEAPGHELYRLQIAVCGDQRAPSVGAFVEVPEALQALVARCLEKEPGARPTAAEAATALRALLDGGATSPGGERRASAAAAGGARRALVAALALAGSALVALWLLAVRGGQPYASSRIAPTATANTEALLAYRAAFEAWRAGNVGTHVWQRVVDQYPDLAAAQLRLALAQVSWAQTEARKHWKAAVERAATLSEADRAMLDALEPVLGSPSDRGEFLSRAERAAKDHPDNIEVLGLLAQAHVDGHELAAAMPLYDRMLELDGRFVPAWYWKTETEAYLGRLDDAAASIRRCLEVNRASEGCLRLRSNLDERDGRCDRIVEDSRTRQAANPENARPYDMLAEALVARGSIEAGKQALAQKWATLPPDAGRRAKLMDEALLAALGGDFGTAERNARALLDLVAGSVDEWEHARPTLFLIDLYTETGRAREATELAHAFEVRREALVPDIRLDDFALARDPTPWLLAAGAAAPSAEPDDLYRRLDAWRQSWGVHGGSWLAGHAWLHGPARVVNDRRSAELALAQLGDPDLLPQFAPMTLIDAPLGKVLALADRGAEALSHLRRAAADCRALQLPFEHTRVLAALGAELEREGDRDGACSEYAAVLARWGRAEPPARTGQLSAERARTLGCPGQGSSR